MLKSLDILIGLTVVMLGLSMAVTLITQAVIAALNSRGRHLLGGLTNLLEQIDPELGGEIGNKIATAVLTHPLVRATTLLGKVRLGAVVHRDEFTRLLIHFAHAESGHVLLDAERKKLAEVLARKGISDPAGTLQRVRDFALRLEQRDPSLAADARASIAMVHAAASDLVARVHAWFDASMDRVSQRFTASTRAITFAGALLVAFGLQVDTIALVNRLAGSADARAAIVAFAQQAADGAAPGAAPAAADVKPFLALMNQQGLLAVPESASAWVAGFSTMSPFGVLITALMLTLGAPFWFATLKKLLQLRSVVAARDDAQRSARREGAAPPAAEGAPPNAPAPQGTLDTPVPPPAPTGAMTGA